MPNATAIIDPHWDLAAIRTAAGQPDSDRAFLDGSTLTVQDVDQAALDAAVAAYDHLGHLRTVAKDRIDRAAGEARARFPSPGDLVDMEYKLAESQAREYAAAGYPADAVPGAVQSWADVADMTPQQAADDIIATADAWTGALEAIRATRLRAKAAVDAATDAAGIDIARNQALAALEAIRP